MTMFRKLRVYDQYLISSPKEVILSGSCCLPPSFTTSIYIYFIFRGNRTTILHIVNTLSEIVNEFNTKAVFNIEDRVMEKLCVKNQN